MLGESRTGCAALIKIVQTVCVYILRLLYCIVLPAMGKMSSQSQPPIFQLSFCGHR